MSGSLGICLLCCFRKEYPGMNPGCCLSAIKVCNNFMSHGRFLKKKKSHGQAAHYSFPVLKGSRITCNVQSKSTVMRVLRYNILSYYIHIRTFMYAIERERDDSIWFQFYSKTTLARNSDDTNCAQSDVSVLFSRYCAYISRSISSEQVVSTFLAVVTTVACMSACIFAVVHLTRLMGLECTPARVLNATCVCRPHDEPADSLEGAIRYVVKSGSGRQITQHFLKNKTII